MLFPVSGIPSDPEERLDIYQTGGPKARHEIDTLFWNAKEDLEHCLATYIRENADAFRRLDNPPPEPPKNRRSKRVEPRTENSIDLADLPHWARVALAARTARRVFPLFRRHWPTARKKRIDAVRIAFELAEESAARGEALPGLEKAVLNATMAAGCALYAVYGGQRTKEAIPTDGKAGAAASAVAKTADRAAEAANQPPRESVFPAVQALNFASGVVTPELWGEIMADLHNLFRVAKRGRWTDETPVPPAVFELMGEKAASERKPWWKFW